MSKQYRYIKLTPNELCYWANNFKLSVAGIGNRGATKLDMHRVKSLAAEGLPFPPIVLAEYLVDGNKKYRVVYGAGLVSAILSCIDFTSEKEKATQQFKKFREYEFTAVVVARDEKENDFVFEAFKGFNRKG